MYRAKLWDEDKWDIHSSSYSSSKHGNIFQNEKKDDKQYHEQKYGQKENNVSSDYIRRQDETDDKEKESKPSTFDNLEEEKNEEKQISEEEISFKAAKQIFAEQGQIDKIEPSKDKETIEDAIKKAIEEEKKVIILNN